MTATGNYKLPFGNLPRLILAWVSTEAVRTQSREIVLGKSFSRVHAGRGGSTAAGAGIEHGSATRWTGSLTPVSG